MTTKEKKTRKSKYYGKTDEEILKEKKDVLDKWTKGLPKDKKENYASKNIGRCEVCGKEYKNIYQHYKTEIHKKRLLGVK